MIKKEELLFVLGVLIMNGHRFNNKFTYFPGINNQFTISSHIEDLCLVNSIFL